jgi:transcription elongation factor Elf1
MRSWLRSFTFDRWTVGKRIGKGPKTRPCPVCSKTRSRRHQDDGRGELLSLKCQNCGTVFTASGVPRVLPDGEAARP